MDKLFGLCDVSEFVGYNIQFTITHKYKEYSNSIYLDNAAGFSDKT